MRWIMASLGLLTVIVVFSLAALDQKNVIWVGGEPECPHCRHEVTEFASVCSTCRRAFDWKSNEVPCNACMNSRDARYYLHQYEASAEAYEAALLNAGIEQEELAGLVEYAESLREGRCGFCGGSGEWLAPGHQEKTTGDGGVAELYPMMRDTMNGKCPVCFGTGRCLLCDGDRMVEIGRESAKRDLRSVEKMEQQINPLRDERSAEAGFQLIDTYVRNHRGRGEIMKIQSFDQVPDPHLQRALDRLKFIQETLSALP